MRHSFSASMVTSCGLIFASFDATAALDVDIETPFTTLAAVAGENPGTWDNNVNGIPDLIEIQCFENLLAGGTAPNAETAFIDNDNRASNDLLPGGEAVVPDLSRMVAWYMTRGTDGDVTFMAEFALDGTVDALTNMKENNGGSTDIATLAAALAANYDVSQSAAVVDFCGPVECPVGSCPDFNTEGAAFFALVDFLADLGPLNGLWTWNGGYGDGGALIDSQDMLDRFEVALLADQLCDPDSIWQAEVCAAYTQNLVTLRTETMYGVLLSPYEHVLAALFTLSSPSDMKTYLDSILPVSLAGTYVSVTSAKAANEPLSPEGDADSDGMSNQDEYDAIILLGGNEADYVESATNPELLGQLPGALPVTGSIGLGLLVGAGATGGLMALRRRKKQARETGSSDECH